MAVRSNVQKPCDASSAVFTMPKKFVTHHGTWRLRDLRTLLEQAVPSPQLDFLETHPLIRNLDTYRDCVPDCFTPSTTPINQT